MEPLHVGDDFFGHPNGLVPPPILSPSHICDHLAIIVLIELVVIDLGLDLLVRLGVDIASLVGEVCHLLVLFSLLLYLLALEVLVFFLMAFDPRHGLPLCKLIHHDSTIILRKLDTFFAF